MTTNQDNQRDIAMNSYDHQLRKCYHFSTKAAGIALVGGGSAYGMYELFQYSLQRNKNNNISAAENKIATLKKEEEKQGPNASIVSSDTYMMPGTLQHVQTLTIVPYKDLMAQQQQIVTLNKAPVKIDGEMIASIFAFSALILALHEVKRRLGSNRFYENAGDFLMKTFHAPRTKSSTPDTQPVLKST